MKRAQAIQRLEAGVKALLEGRVQDVTGMLEALERNQLCFEALFPEEISQVYQHVVAALPGNLEEMPISAESVDEHLLSKPTCVEKLKPKLFDYCLSKVTSYVGERLYLS